MITVAILARICPRCVDPDMHVRPLQAAADEFDINNLERIAAWLAQLAHESVEFNRLEESLSYSAERILQVFRSNDYRKKFRTLAEAQEYARQPEKLANYVYDDANRGPKSKLGNDYPGDGWKYKGRGYIQLTGKDNYTRDGNRIAVDLLNFPQRAAEPDVAARLAGSYWARKGLNELADNGYFDTITQRINTACEGSESRRRYWKSAKEALKS